MTESKSGQAQGTSSQDEIEVLSRCVKLLAKLTPAARGRVSDYIRNQVLEELYPAPSAPVNFDGLDAQLPKPPLFSNETHA